MFLRCIHISPETGDYTEPYIQDSTMDVWQLEEGVQVPQNGPRIQIACQHPPHSHMATTPPVSALRFVPEWRARPSESDRPQHKPRDPKNAVRAC